MGDAYSRCYTECTRHNDCASNKACVRLRCQDPCFEPNPNVCGQGATCKFSDDKKFSIVISKTYLGEATNHKAVCSCPRGYTGDPFVSCRRFEKKDLCTPDPCGPGANCQPGFDRSGVDRPVCTCPAGWRGDPLIRCSRGECINDSECPLDRACYDYNCRSPCDQACGQNAECQVSKLKTNVSNMRHTNGVLTHAATGKEPRCDLLLSLWLCRGSPHCLQTGPSLSGLTPSSVVIALH